MVSPTRFRFKAEYNLDKFGNPEEDSAHRSYGYIPAYHKRPWAPSPYRVANDFICTRLGEFIGLPVPPCVITYNEQLASPCIFSELNFNVDKHKLPRIEADKCVKYLPYESAGILLFDIWIINADRHDENLVVDDIEEPTLIQVFDHGQTLFGGQKGRGCDRLNDLQMRLGITGGAVTGNNRHCLLDTIDTPQHFDDWINTIWSVPKPVIERLFREALRFKLIDRGEYERGVEFLDDRRKCLKSLVELHRTEFSAIADWNPKKELYP